MILVAGSANLDFVVRAPHIPVPGETVLGRELRTFPGGKGANQAIACIRAGGVETEMLLALGSDAYAAPIEASLESAGVLLHVVRVSEQPTGTAFICVSQAAENAITVAPGANSCLVEQHLPALGKFSHLLMQLEIPLTSVAAYARRARTAGVKVLLNAAPVQALSSELLSDLDVLVVNEGELAALAGNQRSLAACLSEIAVNCVVVTLGERGCVARNDGEFFVQPGFPVEAVDTTAAGDTFCGVLAASLARGVGLQLAMRQAAAAAALACTKLGAQQSIPTREETDTFLQSIPGADQEQDMALRRYCGLV
jgi:ribokinase